MFLTAIVYVTVSPVWAFDLSADFSIVISDVKTSIVFVALSCIIVVPSALVPFTIARFVKFPLTVVDDETLNVSSHTSFCFNAPADCKLNTQFGHPVGSLKAAPFNFALPPKLKPSGNLSSTVKL